MNVFNTSLTLASTARTEISDVTPLVKVAIRPFGVSTGIARAHLRAALLGRTGQFQSVIFAELDGPRRREITIQVIGERGHRGAERTNEG